MISEEYYNNPLCNEVVYWWLSLYQIAFLTIATSNWHFTLRISCWCCLDLLAYHKARWIIVLLVSEASVEHLKHHIWHHFNMTTSYDAPLMIVIKCRLIPVAIAVQGHIHSVIYVMFKLLHVYIARYTHACNSYR